MEPLSPLVLSIAHITATARDSLFLFPVLLPLLALHDLPRLLAALCVLLRSCGPWSRTPTTRRTAAPASPVVGEVVLLSSSSSSSSSSKAFSSSNSSVLTATSSRTAPAMEEVWDDISLAILHPERPIAGASPAHQPSRTLQDFFGATGPVNQTLAISPEEALPFLPLRPPCPLPAPPPVLSLNTGLTAVYSSYNSVTHAQNAYFLGPPPPAELTSLISKRRLPDAAANDSDRHNRRMIKNREAAARSRARKQAYTQELEMEASHLKEENAKLKKEYEELLVAMESKPPKRSPLQRSITAPF